MKLTGRQVGLIESGNRELIPLCVAPVTSGLVANTADQCIRNLLAATQRKGYVDSIDLVVACLNQGLPVTNNAEKLAKNFKVTFSPGRDVRIHFVGVW
jgi:hypothetical protein